MLKLGKLLVLDLVEMQMGDKSFTVVITGASRGIGFAMSQRLAQKGHKVVGIARSSPKNGFPGDLLLADLGSESETDRVIKEILDRHQVDSLVNNFGIGGPQSLGAINLDTLRSLFDLNVRTAVQLTQGLVGRMKAQKWGRILNISSRAIFGVPGRTSYAAAKSALIGCTRVWALELAPYGITVNAIAPGPIETEAFRAIRPKGSAEEAELLHQIPLGRIGYPNEVAAAVEYLLSEEGGYVTGQTLCIDGGGSL